MASVHFSLSACLPPGVSATDIPTSRPRNEGQLTSIIYSLTVMRDEDDN